MNRRIARGGENHRNGVWAETLSLCFLLLRGYWPLARRYRSHAGEIDLIARRAGMIVFVEIKRKAELTGGDDLVQARQWRRIAQSAQIFLQQRPKYAHLDRRFDCILLRPGKWPVQYRDAWRE